MHLQSIVFGDTSDVNWEVPEPSDLPYLTGVDTLALDTENSGKNPFEDYVCGVSIAWRDPDNLSIRSLYTPVGHCEGNMDPQVVKSWLEYVLPGKTVIFLNGKYDIQILRTGLSKKFGIDLEALGVKTKDAAFPDALLDDNRRAGRSLEALSQRYLDRGKVEHNFNMDRVASYPSWIFAEYAMGDAINTLEIDEVTAPLIKEQGLDKVLELENSIIYPVCEIERNGCRIDVEKLEKWRREARDEYEKIVLAIQKQTGLMISPKSGEDMMRLFKHIGVEPPIKIVKKKRGQTKEEFEKEQAAAEKNKKEKLREFEIEELQAIKHPIINMIIEARQIGSLLSRFLDAYHDGLSGPNHDIIRGQFHQLKSDEGGTVRGRFSSSGGGDLRSGYSFNAQQVIGVDSQLEATGDRWIIRELFIPDEGMRYGGADMSQIEYRIAVALSGSQRMIEQYQDPNADFHDITEKLIQRYKPDHNNRTKTKNVNFAYVFNSGIDTLASTAGITRNEAEELMGILLQNFPEARDLNKRLINEAEIKGFVQTIYGRRARFGKHDKHHKALNAVVQGSAADVFKVYLKALYDERKTLGIHKLRQVVHDETDFDLYPGDQYITRINEFLSEQRVPLKVPIRWKLLTGKNWRECH